jgi:hypothetical protein
MMMNRNMNVSTTSANKHAPRPYPPGAGQAESRRARRDQVEHAAGDDAADHLRDDVRQQLVAGEPLPEEQPDADRRVEVAARNVPNSVRHRQHGQPEGERDADEADAELGESGREHGAPAAAEHEPERTKKLRDELAGKGHGHAVNLRFR